MHGPEAGRLQHERALAVGKDTIGEPGVLQQRRARIWLEATNVEVLDRRIVARRTAAADAKPRRQHRAARVQRARARDASRMESLAAPRAPALGRRSVPPTSPPLIRGPSTPRPR